MVFIRGDLSLVEDRVSAQAIEGKTKQRFVWDPECMKQKSGARGGSRKPACVMGTGEVKRQLIVLQGVGPC